MATKRTEISAANQKKHDDEIRASALKEERERVGANPHMRRGQPSRYDRYKSTDAGKSAEKPWQSSHSSRERNTDWRNQALSKVREAQAA